MQKTDKEEIGAELCFFFQLDLFLPEGVDNACRNPNGKPGGVYCVPESGSGPGTQQQGMEDLELCNIPYCGR